MGSADLASRLRPIGPAAGTRARCKLASMSRCAAVTALYCSMVMGGVKCTNGIAHRNLFLRCNKHSCRVPSSCKQTGHWVLCSLSASGGISPCFRLCDESAAAPAKAWLHMWQMWSRGLTTAGASCMRWRLVFGLAGRAKSPATSGSGGAASALLASCMWRIASSAIF
eukprot:4092291-Amphidinium_carterae.5